VIDPLLSLAYSMHAGKGIYALLLGSGLSRASGIPTGYEIVLDLIRKLAVLTNEDCEPDPEAWYRARFNEEPDYSGLLDQIAKSPAERQQLLRSYFEPNNEEREQGLKMPTEGHKAIAALIASGHVRVIVTTNFDRLMEKALEAVGVVPTVISSPDHASGALPLTHTRCTIIKINGDYIDTRIRNTPSELENYEPEMNSLLDRVFDEYGLVVAGWSAQWDTALRAAIERCPTHRFTTFWCVRGKLSEETKGLVERRRAILIEIKDADSFFQTLSEKVTALDALSVPHPLSAQIAVATLKRYLPEEKYKIRVRDLVIDEANRLHEELSDARYPVDGVTITYDTVAERAKEFESLTEVLRAIIITGCYWGEEFHQDIWKQCLERIADPGGKTGGYDLYLKLKLYPALLLLYAGGIAAVAAGNYGNLATLLIRARGNLPYKKEAPLGHILDPESVLEPEAALRLLKSERKLYTPTNDYLFQVLREPLRNLIPRDAEYQRSFDRFEYLFSLVSGDLYEKIESYTAWNVGCFLWRDRDHLGLKESVLGDLYHEIESAAGSWSGFKAGLFDGSIDRFQFIKSKFDDDLPRLRQSRRIW
jgi:hypothetical protein